MWPNQLPASLTSYKSEKWIKEEWVVLNIFKNLYISIFTDNRVKSKGGSKEVGKSYLKNVLKIKMVTVNWVLSID